MTTESELRAKLRKIEALFARAGTLGERDAAEAALGRIKAKLGKDKPKEAPKPRLIEMKFGLENRWSRTLFVALCRRHKLKPYRYPRQRRTTVMVRVDKEFVNKILWPEFLAIDKELMIYLNSATDKIIREEVYEDIGEAEEVPEVVMLR